MSSSVIIRKYGFSRMRGLNFPLLAGSSFITAIALWNTSICGLNV